jgi:hypothetical protein
MQQNVRLRCAQSKRYLALHTINAGEDNAFGMTFSSA